MENSSLNGKPAAERGTGKITFFLGFFSGLALISVVGFFVLLGFLFSGRESVDLAAKAGDSVAAQPEDLPAEETPALPVRAVDKNDHYQGNLDAKVQFIIYDDFECPFCLRHEDTLKALREKYSDKELVFVYRHFPLGFHANAQNAAMASECAAEQGEFWPMHDKIFEAQGNAKFTVDQFKADAKSLGLDAKKFNDCLDSNKYLEKINSQLAEGSSFGVEGTPGNFINGQLIAGAYPLETFTEMIDSILGK